MDGCESMKHGRAMTWTRCTTTISGTYYVRRPLSVAPRRQRTEAVDPWPLHADLWAFPEFELSKIEAWSTFAQNPDGRFGASF